MPGPFAGPGSDSLANQEIRQDNPRPYTEIQAGRTGFLGAMASSCLTTRLSGRDDGGCGSCGWGLRTRDAGAAAWSAVGDPLRPRGRQDAFLKLRLADERPPEYRFEVANRVHLAELHSALALTLAHGRGHFLAVEHGRIDVAPYQLVPVLSPAS